MTYPKANITNIMSYVDMLKYADSVTNGYFSIGSIITVWSITFIATSAYSVEKAMMYSSFVSFIMAVFYFAMGVIDTQLLFILMILMGLPALLLATKK